MSRLSRRNPVSTRYFGPDFLISLIRNCGVNRPPIVILDDRIADVDSPARADMLVQGRLLESDGRNQRIGLLSLNQVHFQMLPLGSPPAGRRRDC